MVEQVWQRFQDFASMWKEGGIERERQQHLSSALVNDKCPICFEEIPAKELCRPDACGHRFCFEHLYEWSLSSSECPYCRREFHDIVHIRQTRPATSSISLSGTRAGPSNGRNTTRPHQPARARRGEPTNLVDWEMFGVAVGTAVVVVGVVVLGLMSILR